jgi:hypothetical protein
VQCVFDACLLLFHLHFSTRTYLDHGNATGEFRNTLLQLFAIVVRRGFLDLGTNLSDASLNVGCIACTIDDCGVFLADLDALGTTQIISRSTFQA